MACMESANEVNMEGPAGGIVLVTMTSPQLKPTAVDVHIGLHGITIVGCKGRRDIRMVAIVQRVPWSWGL